MATLDRYLQSKGRLSAPQAAKVILEVVRRMIANGDHGVVHPGRISIGADRAVHLVAEDRTLPVAIELPRYAAPEIVQGGAQSEASALYSIGCTFFELLSGSPPFNSSEPRETLKAHLESSPPALSDLVPETPAVLATIVAGLLVKSPEKRGSLTDLEKRLARTLGTGQKQASGGGKAPAAPAASAAPTAGGARAKTAARKPAAPSARAKSPRPGGRRTASSEGGSAHAPAKRSHGKPARKSRSLAMRRRGRRGVAPELDDGSGEGDLGYVIPRRRKTYPLSMLGALLGVIVGVFLLFKDAQQSSRQPEALAQKKEHEIETVRENRKKAYAAELRRRGEAVTALLRRSRGIGSSELRYDWLVKGMDEHFSSPQGPQLASAVQQAHAERDREMAGPGEKNAAEEPEYTRIKTLAQTLYDQGRLGDAYNKMADAYQDYRNQHSEEIDAFIQKVSTELDERWKKDKAAIERYFAASETAAAVKLLKDAQKYGDASIRREVEDSLNRVEEILVIQQGSRDDDAGGFAEDEPADEEQEEEAADDWGDDAEDEADDWGDDEEGDQEDGEEKTDDEDDWGDDWGDDEESGEDDWGDDEEGGQQEGGGENDGSGEEEGEEGEEEDDWDEDWDDEDWDDDWGDDEEGSDEAGEEEDDDWGA